ncbi:ppm-1.A [Symbiodinium sp. CCMP2592]|nr:ppm-1.A [Symbiodinium sp. CCMP2592]
MASSTHEDVDWEVPCDKNWREDPRVVNRQLPPQWFKTSNGSDPFPDYSHGPIYKVKDRDKKRQELDTITDDNSAALCKDLPGSIAAMGNYRRGELKMSDLSELMSHYDRLAGYNPDKPETPQNTLFCGPESEETWRMRRKYKTGMRVHSVGPNLSCNDSQFTSHAHARFYLSSCDETAPTREEAPFVPRKLDARGYMGWGPEEYAAMRKPPERFPVILETVDHKPDHPTEKFRIEAAGGTVTMEDPPRLDGSLAVSRGLGDFEYKGDGQRLASEQKVSCVPDIYEISSLQPGSICVLGCDGIWDVMTAEDVAEYVREELSMDPPTDLGDVAAELLRLCLKKNSRDNMTCMILQLVDGSDSVGFPDEMKNYEKLLERGDQDEDVQSHYASFLTTSKFPPQALSCDVCKRWLLQMNQSGP